MSDDEMLEAFLNVVCDSGTPVASCGWCNTMLYDQSGEFMEPGELDDLEAKRAKHPAKYRPIDGSVSYGHVFGRQTLFDCKCHILRKNILAIYGERLTISRFIRACSARNLEIAVAEEKEAEGL